MACRYVQRQSSLTLAKPAHIGLDGMPNAAGLTGWELPRLAMLSWRGSGGRTLPLDCQTIKNAAELDVSHSGELTSLPSSLQARSSRSHDATCLARGGLLGACKASIYALQVSKPKELHVSPS